MQDKNLDKIQQVYVYNVSLCFFLQEIPSSEYCSVRDNLIA